MKKSFLYFFILFIFLPILFNTGCKTTEEAEVYDIRGIWDLIVWFAGGVEGPTWKITFVGSETSGTASDTPGGDNGTGTYTVNNKQATFIMNYTLLSGACTYTGTFINPDHITGTWQVGSDFGLFDLFR